MFCGLQNVAKRGNLSDYEHSGFVWFCIQPRFSGASTKKYIYRFLCHAKCLKKVLVKAQEKMLDDGEIYEFEVLDAEAKEEH
jgi:hypothetical protein